MIGLMMPFFFLAMYERDGQPAEKILKNMLRHRMWPEHRPYKTQNFYRMISQKEVSHIAKNKQQEAQEKRLQRNIRQAKKDRAEVKGSGKKLCPVRSRPGAFFFLNEKRMLRRPPSRVSHIKKCTGMGSAG